MALFKKSSSVKPSETTQTVSEEKEELLPENKKTLSSIAINKTNTLLVFSSIATIVIFIIIMIVRSFQSSRQIRKIAEEPVVETTVSQDSNKELNSSDTNKKSEEKKEDIYIPPVVTLEPNSITIEGQTIGDETFKSINL